MIVCACAGVSDRAIRAAMDAGATTVGSIARMTRAGRDCGSCACDLRKMLQERAARSAETLPLAAK